MVVFRELQTDTEFACLIPLIAQFSLCTETPLWKNVGEVAQSFVSPNFLTYIFVDEEGVITGYGHGNFLNGDEFHISQWYNKKGEGNKEAWEKLKTTLRSREVKKVVCLTTLNPKVFEKYGFKFERYFMGQTI